MVMFINCHMYKNAGDTRRMLRAVWWRHCELVPSRLCHVHVDWRLFNYNNLFATN